MKLMWVLDTFHNNAFEVLVSSPQNIVLLPRVYIVPLKVVAIWADIGQQRRRKFDLTKVAGWGAVTLRTAERIILD